MVFDIFRYYFRHCFKPFFFCHLFAHLSARPPARRSSCLRLRPPFVHPRNHLSIRLRDPATLDATLPHISCYKFQLIFFMIFVLDALAIFVIDLFISSSHRCCRKLLPYFGQFSSDFFITGLSESVNFVSSWLDLLIF